MADFRIGGTQIASGKIKVGDSDVSKIYQGTTLVWPPAASNCGPNTTIVGDLCWTTENETSTTTQGSTFTLSTTGVSQGTPSTSYRVNYASGHVVVFAGFDNAGYSQNYSGSGCLTVGNKYKITFTDGTTTFDGVWEFEGNGQYNRHGAFTTFRPSSYWECSSNSNALTNDDQYWMVSFYDADFNDRESDLRQAYECDDVGCNTTNTHYSGNQWTVTVGDLNDTSYTYSTAQSITMATTNQQLLDYIDDGVPAACWWDFDSNNSYRGLYYNAYAARLLQPPSGYRLPTQSDWDDLRDAVRVTGLSNVECTALVTDDQNSGWPSSFYNLSHAASSGMDIYPYDSVIADGVPFATGTIDASFWREEAANPHNSSAVFESTPTIHVDQSGNFARIGNNTNDYKYATLRWVKDV